MTYDLKILNERKMALFERASLIGFTMIQIEECRSIVWIK